MKLIIICAIAAVTLADGPDGIHGESNRLIGLHDRNPYKYLLRSSRNDQTCAPGSTMMMNCHSCICTGSGKWLCTVMGCLWTQPGHEVADGLITSPDEATRLIRSERDTANRECEKEGDVRRDFFTCYCDSEGFYSLCVSVAQNDIENPAYQTIEMTNPDHDFNLEMYRTTP